MRIENIEQAVRFKERRDNLLKAKSMIERHATSTIVGLHDGMDGNMVRIQDDCLTGIIHKYCEDTIALLEKAIEDL